MDKLVIVYLMFPYQDKAGIQKAFSDIENVIKENYPDCEVITSTNRDEILNVVKERYEEAILLTNSPLMRVDALDASDGKIALGWIDVPSH